jgi:hypothetical protein
MRKIMISAFTALSLFASDMALAQNADNLDSNDVIQAIRRDSNGNGTRGSVPSTTTFDGVGIGYGSGGSAVTQATSRTTGVTINAYSGAITLVSAAGSATAASFTVTNNKIAATDVVVLSQKSGTDLYNLEVTAVAAGSFRITFFTTGGTTTEQPVINFAIVRGKAS